MFVGRAGAVHGERLLIHGASGAVGLAAVQIGKAHGMFMYLFHQHTCTLDYSISLFVPIFIRFFLIMKIFLKVFGDVFITSSLVC